MRRTMPLLALTLLLPGWTPLGGQEAPGDPFARGPDRAGIVLDSVRLALSARPEWRGFALGSTGGTVFVDIGLAGRPTSATGTWGLAAHATGTKVWNARSTTISAGHWGGGLSLFRYFNAGEGAVALVTEAYDVPDASADGRGVEVGLRLDGLDWNWGLDEVNPVLGLAVYRDFGRFDAFRADLDFNVGFGVQNVAFWVFNTVSAWIEGRASWSDYPVSFGPHDDLGGRAGLGVALDQGSVAVVGRGGLSRPLDASGRLYGEVAFRIWPDGRNR